MRGGRRERRGGGIGEGGQAYIAAFHWQHSQVPPPPSNGSVDSVAARAHASLTPRNHAFTDPVAPTRISTKTATQRGHTNNLKKRNQQVRGPPGARASSGLNPDPIPGRSGRRNAARRSGRRGSAARTRVADAAEDDDRRIGNGSEARRATRRRRSAERRVGPEDGPLERRRIQLAQVTHATCACALISARRRLRLRLRFKTSLHEQGTGGAAASVD